jgi:2-aminoadipate transaminase
VARTEIGLGQAPVDRHLIRWAESFAARTRSEASGGLAEILALSGATDVISFSGGFPDPATFPGPVLADLVRELIESGDPTGLQYAPTPGLPGPREFIASRLESLEGLRPDDPELLVTSGGVECLELAGKSFLDPGDLVLVEGPTYLGAIMAFRSFEATVRAVPMDEAGLRVDMLEAALAEGGPKLLYTIPDHQNPAGVSLAEDRRGALVELARRYGFLIVEDVAYRELGFDGRRLPSLWSLGPDVVLQSGTFSKTFFPGVRLGWAAGPAEVVAQLTMAKQLTDQCASPLAQRLLEEYGRRGYLDRQIARAREPYGRRCALLMAAFERYLPEGISWTRPRGGFFSWVTLPGGSDSIEITRRAMDAGVAVVPGMPFYPDGRGTENVRVAFSKVADGDIEEGVRRFSATLEPADPRARPARARS